MNSVNSATGLTGFQLKSGFSPRLLPVPRIKLITPREPALKIATDIIENIKTLTWEAQDSLRSAKIEQAHFANMKRGEEPVFKEGEDVYISTEDYKKDFTLKNKDRVSKLVPFYDGPFTIIKAKPSSSNYTLKLPRTNNRHPTFHVSKLKKYIPNDNEKFPTRKESKPGPIKTKDGKLEHVIQEILDEKIVQGGGKQYLIRWKGYGRGDDEWLPRKELLENEALDIWEQQNNKKNIEGASVS